MKKILIIEDEPEMRRNLATILRLERFEPVTAANGEQGLKLARDQAPDLVLCDVMMPGISGYDVLKALHQDPAVAKSRLFFSPPRAREMMFATA
jgi:CheY-like chemotaxis protein